MSARCVRNSTRADRSTEAMEGNLPSGEGAPGAEELAKNGPGGEPRAVQTPASELESDPEPEPEPRETELEQPKREPEPEVARGVAYQVTRTPATVACCICGAPIAANPLSMCAPCIATNGNVAESLPSRCELQNCRTCGRYLLPRKVWAVADWESRELMAVCLKKLKGLSRLKLVDAQFIWTEPHSKRTHAHGTTSSIACALEDGDACGDRFLETVDWRAGVKVKLTVQDDVYSGTVLEQQCVVEYVIINVQVRRCATSVGLLRAALSLPTLIAAGMLSSAVYVSAPRVRIPGRQLSSCDRRSRTGARFCTSSS